MTRLDAAAGGGGGGARASPGVPALARMHAGAGRPAPPSAAAQPAPAAPQPTPVLPAPPELPAAPELPPMATGWPRPAADPNDDAPAAGLSLFGGGWGARSAGAAAAAGEAAALAAARQRAASKSARPLPARVARGGGGAGLAPARINTTPFQARWSGPHFSLPSTPRLPRLGTRATWRGWCSGTARHGFHTTRPSFPRFAIACTQLGAEGPRQDP
jgi:hypothetical protein